MAHRLRWWMVNGIWWWEHHHQQHRWWRHTKPLLNSLAKYFLYYSLLHDPSPPFPSYQKPPIAKEKRTWDVWKLVDFSDFSICWFGSILAWYIFFCTWWILGEFWVNFLPVFRSIFDFHFVYLGLFLQRSIYIHAFFNCQMSRSPQNHNSKCWAELLCRATALLFCVKCICLRGRKK